MKLSSVAKEKGNDIFDKQLLPVAINVVTYGRCSYTLSWACNTCRKYYFSSIADSIEEVCNTFSLRRILVYQTWSSPRRSLFLPALSFQCTSKLCITFLSQFFSLFSYFKNALHNLVIELCSAPFFPRNIAQLFINFTHSFVAIELLTFCKNAKKRFYCSRELSLFWLNK